MQRKPCWNSSAYLKSGSSKSWATRTILMRTTRPIPARISAAKKVSIALLVIPCSFTSRHPDVRLSSVKMIEQTRRLGGRRAQKSVVEFWDVSSALELLGGNYSCRIGPRSSVANTWPTAISRTLSSTNIRSCCSSSGRQSAKNTLGLASRYRTHLLGLCVLCASRSRSD
jgi:hypothetical protein